MAFEWQDRETAARTLEVDLETLQAWIDDGRAPSRQQNGNVQVLIELLDDEEEADTVDASIDDVVDRDADAGAPRNGRQQEGPRSHDRINVDDTDVAVVTQRELQLAGGMIAAWQRVAETAEQSAKRSRQLGTLSWSIVALFVVLGGIGLWASTRTVSDVQGRLNTAQSDLANANKQLAGTQTTVTDLRSKIDALNTDLETTRASLAGLTERASVSEQKNEDLEKTYQLTQQLADQLSKQLELTKELAGKQAEESRTLIETMRATLSQSTARINTLETLLANASTKVDKLEEQLREQKEATAAAERERNDAQAQRDAAQTQRDAAIQKQNVTAEQLDQIRTEVETLQTQLTDLRKQAAKDKSDLSTAEKKQKADSEQITRLQGQIKSLQEELEKLKKLAANE